MDNEIDKKIDVIAILFLLVQNRQQTHDWTLIGSVANGLGIQEWYVDKHCSIALHVRPQFLESSDHEKAR